VLRGNLFDSAIMKLSVISPEFRERYLSDPADPDAFEGPVVVFDGPEDYHARIDDPALGIDERTLLIMRGAGPIGYPGAAEVVNMRPPVQLIQKGISRCRASATAASRAQRKPFDPQRLARSGGGRRSRLAPDRRPGADRLAQGHREHAGLRHRAGAAPRSAGGRGRLRKFPASQTPWQEIQRAINGQAETGAVLEPAVKYQRLAQTDCRQMTKFGDCGLAGRCLM
jgi:dihydroxy-acid dehydratase